MQECLVSDLYVPSGAESGRASTAEDPSGETDGSSEVSVPYSCTRFQLQLQDSMS
jgi:hypothetical protein